MKSLSKTNGSVFLFCKFLIIIKTNKYFFLYLDYVIYLNKPFYTVYVSSL